MRQNLKYKLIATDCDGTLLRSDNDASDYTKRIIEKYIAGGGIFMVSTGRMYASARNMLRRTGIRSDMVIAYNGAMVCDNTTGKIIRHNPLPCAAAARQAGLLESEPNSMIHMYHDDRLYVREMTEYTRGYEKICEVTATPVHKPLSGYIRENNWDVTKLICFARPEHVEKLLVSYGEKFGKDISYSSSNATFFEVLNRGASKGNAVKSVAEEKGIPPEDVMAFGDALNDVSMLEYAGLSFAMANGDPRVKEAAKEVCPSNDDDGVARMIEKYCL